MTHLYLQPIAVTLTGGKPATIRWHDVIYQVAQVNEPWHLPDRKWQSDATGARSSGCNWGDRTYYRVQCVSATGEDLICDIYFESVSRGWVLERIYD